MAKNSNRSRSRYADEALHLLGQMIRAGRIERRWTAVELAARAGISPSLLKRMETGSPGCEIGAVFETAALVGIRLFDADEDRLAAMNDQVQGRLALLPKSVHKPRKVNDEF